eukprot:Blabericola_migrator_1__2168@NODE_159_length_12571_cov_158_810301_g139_i0_p4_GENE_NODE_159_length_12571_cov_158_810301_g139_i0NODE_159_length_12571_cov_158_810301_g139_i0_p4_ORF_typecomplete_len214_score14_10_NODE_159_length_12571_cov_158_810301_g139_i01189912540
MNGTRSSQGGISTCDKSSTTATTRQRSTGCVGRLLNNFDPVLTNEHETPPCTASKAKGRSHPPLTEWAAQWAMPLKDLRLMTGQPAVISAATKRSWTPYSGSPIALLRRLSRVPLSYLSNIWHLSVGSMWFSPRYNYVTLPSKEKRQPTFEEGPSSVYSDQTTSKVNRRVPASVTFPNVQKAAVPVTASALQQERKRLLTSQPIPRAAAQVVM